jgi:CBS domain-containing protein
MTTTVVTARPDTTFQQLVDLMFRHGVGGIPVVDDDGHPVGIVTETDLVTHSSSPLRGGPIWAATRPVLTRTDRGCRA